MRSTSLILCCVLVALAPRQRCREINQAGGCKDAGRPTEIPDGDGVGSVVPQRRVPHDEFFAGSFPINTGDYVSARVIFQNTPRCIRSTDGRWVDSFA